MSVILPPAGIVRPDVIGLFGCSEVYADGGICTIGDLMCETVLYRRYSGTERHAIMRVIMPRATLPQDGHEVSLLRAYLESVRGIAH